MIKITFVVPYVLIPTGQKVGAAKKGQLLLVVRLSLVVVVEHEKGS